MDAGTRCCLIHAHGRLRRFLSPGRRAGIIEYRFSGTPALKDPLEALGIPHTEAGRVCVDGRIASLRERLQGGEQVEVSPVEHQSAGEPPRFVLDVHLGRLARDLRLLGFDTLFRNDASDEALAAISAAESRVLLTRDTGLLKRSVVVAGAFVYATDPREQLGEVCRRFSLAGQAVPFSRCMHCNAPVHEVSAASVTRDVPERIHRRMDTFRRCEGCHRVYWRGSHEAGLVRRMIDAGITPGRHHVGDDIHHPPTA